MLPARGMVVLACNPCPCGDYIRDARPTGATAARCSAATTAQGHRPDHRPDRHHPARRAAPTPTAKRDRFARPGVVRRRAGAGRGGPGPAGRALRRHELAAQRPGARARSCASAGRSPTEASRLVDDQLYDGRLTRRGATRVHRLAWTVADLAGVDRPGRRRGRHRAAAAHRRAAAGCRPLRRAAPDDRPETSGSPGSRSASSASPATRGWPRLVADLGPSALLRPAARRSATSHGVLTDVAGRLAGPRPRARPRAGRPAAASGSSSPATTSGRPSSTTSTRVEPLQERGGAPLGLWVRGPLRLDAARRRRSRSSASRSATTYGADVAGDIGAGRGRAPARTVVSGAAFGIDQAAHRGALAGDGAHGRGARLRRRPRLPGRAPAAARPHRRARRGRVRGRRRAARPPGSGSCPATG